MKTIDYEKIVNELVKTNTISNVIESKSIEIYSDKLSSELVKTIDYEKIVNELALRGQYDIKCNRV